jgi:hypothetical protein
MRITTQLPATRFERPNREQLGRLLEIAEAAFPHLVGLVEIEELSRAMVATGLMWRLDSPNTVHSVPWLLDHANNSILTEQLGLRTVEGAAFQLAVACHGDIKWRAGRPNLGECYEIALHPWTGARCSNAWKQVLDTGELLAPVAPRGVRSSYPLPRPRSYEVMPDGSQRPLGDGAMWSRS